MANAPAGDVPCSPTRPLFSLSVVLSACLPWSFLCLSSAGGPARGQIQSDLAMVCLGWLNNGPSSGSLLVLASRLSTRMLPCWSTLDFYIIATHLQPMVIPTPGPFLVRLAAVVREYGLPFVDLLDLLCLPPPMQLTSGAKAFNNHSPFPLVRPIFTAGERIKRHESRFHPLLLEYFESDGQLGSPQPVLVIVAGSFACLSSPCAPLPVSSLPCLSSDTVWLVLWLVTALQGPCQMFVLWESAGLALFRSLTVPLLGSVPSRAVVSPFFKCPILNNSTCYMLKPIFTILNG